MNKPGTHRLRAPNRFIGSLAMTGFVLTSFSAPTMCSAAVVTVTPLSSDPFFYTYVAGTGLAEITSTRPRSGDGALELSHGIGGNSAYISIAPDNSPFGTWGNLSALAFDSFTETSSPNSLSADIALRVYPWGDPRTFYLHWTLPVPKGSWQHIDALGHLLIQQETGGPIPPATLADIPADAPITQLHLRAHYNFGSAWYGFMDNVTLGFGGNEPVTYNFEPVPEPTSLAAICAVFGLALRRRRRTHDHVQRATTTPSRLGVM